MLFLSMVLAATMAAPPPPLISPAEARELQVKGEAIVVDVRGSVPYELGHISGAVWMPLGLMRDRGLELPQDKLIVTYCTCSHEQTSIEGAEVLRDLGFERVAVMTGGYPAWVEAKLPVETAEDMAVAPASAAGARVGRIAPPAGVSCDRNHLTVYSGVVTSYRRSDKQTKITIRTDADTTEKVVIDHGKAKDPGRYYLILGTPLTSAADWKQFEEKPRKLRKGMRANIWVCSSGATVVDWRPGESGGPGI